MKGDGNPFLGVPEGAVCVENPDGVYHGGREYHSLYNGPLNYPLIPGDYDYAKEVGPDYREAFKR